jgi:hypothetical protein
MSIILIYIIYLWTSHKLLIRSIEMQSHSENFTLTEVFPCFFLSCKANARVILAKMGHAPHSCSVVNLCGTVINLGCVINLLLISVCY